MGDGKGLKGQWGVKDAAPAASDRQAKEFNAAFNAVKAQIAGSLSYTSEYAQKNLHQKLVAKQTKLYQAYNKVVGMIDPTNPAKAAGAIQTVLGSADKVRQQAQTLQQDTQAAYDNWMAQSEFYAEAERQVEELEIWGAQWAAPFLPMIATIKEDETARDWKAADSSLRKLITELQPAYEDYLKQKAAKEAYDLTRPNVDGLFGAARDHPKPTPEMSALQAEIEGQMTRMDAAAEGKNFVSALEELGPAGDNVAKLQELRDEHEKLEKEYLERLPDVEKRVGEASDSGYETLEPQLPEIKSISGQMESTAGTGDYQAALDHMSDLEEKLDTFEADFAALEQKRQAYEDRLLPLQGRVTLMQFEGQPPSPKNASPWYPTITPQSIRSALDSVEEAGDAEDYDKAMSLMDVVEGMLDGVLDEIGQEIARIEIALSDLKPRRSTQHDLAEKLEKQAKSLEQHAVLAGSKNWKPDEDTETMAIITKVVETVTNIVGKASYEDIKLDKRIDDQVKRELERLAKEANEQAAEARSELEVMDAEIAALESQRDYLASKCSAG